MITLLKCIKLCQIVNKSWSNHASNRELLEDDLFTELSDWNRSTEDL